MIEFSTVEFNIDSLISSFEDSIKLLEYAKQACNELDSQALTTHLNQAAHETLELASEILVLAKTL